MRKVIDALWDCHETGQIMHRDVKPENIVINLDRNGQIFDLKLIDLGLACDVLDCLSYLTFDFGTIGYIAPEVIEMRVCK